MYLTFKNDMSYYGSRLKDQDLLLHAVKVRIGRDRFLCIPCGESRITGFTHFFKNLTEANIVYRTLVDSGENFPNLRVEPVTNVEDKRMYIVKWGVPEPSERYGFLDWNYEVAIAKQLGYSDECMPAHFERCQRFYRSMTTVEAPLG